MEENCSHKIHYDLEDWQYEGSLTQITKECIKCRKKFSELSVYCLNTDKNQELLKQLYNAIKNQE